MKEGLGRWEKWTESLRNAPPIPANFEYSQIVVPTQGKLCSVAHKCFTSNQNLAEVVHYMETLNLYPI